MSSVNSILFQLRNGFISETIIPNNYMYIPEVKEAILQYNWIPSPSYVVGWTNLKRYINYSS